MGSTRADDHADRFVLALLRAGSTFCQLIPDLIDAMPADAHPGEDPGTIVIEMLCGTIAAALEFVDPPDVRRATELIDLAADRTIQDLRLACGLSERTNGRQAYG